MTARNPTWVEQDYRFYNDDGAAGSNTPMVAINTTTSIQISTKFRVVINIGDTNNATQNNVTGWRLQYRRNAGSWVHVNDDSNVTSTTSTFNSDGDSLGAQRLNSITGSIFDATFDQFCSADAITTEQTWADDFTEYEFCLVLGGAVAATDTIDLRLVTESTVIADGTVPTITNTPTLTATAAPAGGSTSTFGRKLYVMP